MFYQVLFLIVILFFLLCATLATFFYISGLFHPLDVSIKDGDLPYLNDGSKFFYKTHNGSYNNVGHLFTEAYSIFPTAKQCGIYYDDPKDVGETKCRSAIGVVTEHSNEAMEMTIKEHNFKSFKIPPLRGSIHVQFPHISFLSILIGAYRVYPAIRNYALSLDAKLSAIIEVYDEQYIHFIGITNPKADLLVHEFRTLVKSDAEESDENFDKLEESYEKIQPSDLGDCLSNSAAEDID